MWAKVTLGIRPCVLNCQLTGGKMLALWKHKSANSATKRSHSQPEEPKQHQIKKKKKEKKAGVQEEICMGTLSLDPQRSRSADVTGRGSLLSLHLSVEEYKFITQPGTGRSPLRLLSSVYRRARSYLSCMVDILLNTSFLDDMGDHSKSKLLIFFAPLILL